MEVRPGNYACKVTENIVSKFSKPEPSKAPTIYPHSKINVIAKMQELQGSWTYGEQNEHWCQEDQTIPRPERGDESGELIGLGR